MKLWHRRLRNLVLLLLVLGVIAVGLLGARRALRSAPDELSPLTMMVQPRDFTLLIAAKGELQSVQATAIAVPPVPVNRLRIASVIADGRYVNKGDVLIEFDPEELDLQKREHNAGLEMVRQKLDKGSLASQSEKTDIGKDRKIAELELRKINESLPQDEQIYSRRDIIEGQLNQAYAEKKIVFADAKLTLKDKVYSLDEAILLLERRQADSMLGRVDKALASLKLLAPASGIVVYPNSGFFFGGSALMPGKVVWIGMTLFQLVNPDQMEAKIYVLEKDAGELKAEQNQRTQRIFNIVMSAIASISLLVGGIGIMNIMLANILERTREIGVRRALGARRRDIWQQFLIEALTISLIGGVTGVLFGFVVSRVVALYADWSTVVTWASIALSFGVAATTGLLFGIYPAVRASRLDPVEALRYE
jgi:multidrug efflux pump subunit AcrA (membrane-fusion protein)